MATTQGTGERRARLYRVRGRVHGVGFRYFVERNAARLGVAGWVCNRADGSVEAWAEADETALNAFEAALRQGPALSRVDGVEASSVDLGGERGFRVRY